MDQLEAEHIYLSIYFLIDDIFGTLDYTASNGSIVSDNALDRIWKEAVIA
jgi:hypothetical protein